MFNQERYPQTMHVSGGLADEIDRPVERALVSSRKGAGNTTLSFLKGDIIADQLNQVFGPLGWNFTCKIHSIEDYESIRVSSEWNGTKQPDKNVWVTAVVSNVTLTIKKTTPDGSDTIIETQGVGLGEVESSKSRKDSMGMAIKGASTDGLKRCASMIGRRFGMFLVDGEQDDIVYAHNAGKDADKRSARNNARRMRDEDYRRYQETRPEPRQLTDQRSDDRPVHLAVNNDREPDNARSDDRRDDRGNDDRNNQTRDQSGSSDKQAPKQTRNNDDAAPASRTKAAPESAAAEAGRDNAATGPAKAADDGKGAASGAPAINENYPLDNIPVTRQHQLDFGASIVAAVRDVNQIADREGLVRRYAVTINGLDKPIRDKVMLRLGEHGVDAEAILR